MTALPPLPPPPESDADAAKPAWPLFAVAALAFLPVLGFLFGAIAFIWGLLSSRPHARRAAVIAAAGATLNLAGILGLAWVTTRHSDNYDRIVAEQTRQELLALVRGIEEYREEHDAYPPSLSELQRRPVALRTINIYDRMSGILSPRVYAYRLARDGRTYDLFSAGADGEAGTPDDIRPVLSDSLAARAGFRPDITPYR